MALDSSINRSALIDIFPDLAEDKNFKILSEVTPIYNCIAWAMGYTDRWVDPERLTGHWWPEGVPREATPETLVAAFKAEGFEQSENGLPEEGYNKVVLYKKENAEEWTHAAQVVSTDIEYSKFGQAWDGQHSHNVLRKTTIGRERLSYGIAYAYMKKRKDVAPVSSISGNITVNQSKLAELKARLGK